MENPIIEIRRSCLRLLLIMEIYTLKYGLNNGLGPWFLSFVWKRTLMRYYTSSHEKRKYAESKIRLIEAAKSKFASLYVEYDDHATKHINQSLCYIKKTPQSPVLLMYRSLIINKDVIGYWSLVLEIDVQMIRPRDIEGIWHKSTIRFWICFFYLHYNGLKYIYIRGDGKSPSGSVAP